MHMYVCVCIYIHIYIHTKRFIYLIVCSFGDVWSFVCLVYLLIRVCISASANNDDDDDDDDDDNNNNNWLGKKIN